MGSGRKKNTRREYIEDIEKIYGSGKIYEFHMFYDWFNNWN